MNTQELFLTFTEAAAQVHVFHLSTNSYAEHQAFGELYDAIADASDSWIEALIGNADGKRPKLGGEMEIKEYTPTFAREYVSAFGGELEAIKGLPTDVLNMRDDLLAKVHKTSYLLSLS